MTRRTRHTSARANLKPNAAQSQRIAAPPRLNRLAKIMCTSLAALGWCLGAAIAQDAGAPDPRDARIAELEARLTALEAAMAPPQAAIVAPLAGDPERIAPAATASEPSETVRTQRLAAERALERTLVRRGAVTLASGQAEIEPSLAYVRSEQDQPVLISTPAGADVARADLRRDEAVARLTARIGLPYRTQADLSVGFSAAREEERLLVGGPAGALDRDGTAFNDVSLTISHTLIASDGGGPDVLLRATYNNAAGDTNDNGVAFGNGFEDVSVGASAMFRQDPLVFVASADYAASFERGGIKPGDQIRVAGAALLAVSPETSLRFGVSGAVGQDAEINGVELAGSAVNAASLDIGFASVISKRALLDINLSLGLTEDSPDYALVVSIPIRFSNPFWR